MKVEPKPGRFDALRKMLDPIAKGMGLHLEGRRSTVNGDPVLENEFVFRMPVLRATADLDGIEAANPSRIPDLLMQAVDAARDRLFHSIREHLAQHDRSPIDRLQQIEAAARAVLPDDAWNDTNEQGNLRQLLDTKPGAVSWRRCSSDPKIQPKETPAP